MHQKYHNLRELARPFLTVRHNQGHTDISFQYAVELLEREGGREHIVLPAIILHDIGWSAVPEDLHLKAFGPNQFDEDLRRIHEIEGAKMAADLLPQFAVNEQDAQEICEIIERHDSGLQPETLEEKIVKDADKLWRFSPHGFSINRGWFRLDPHEYWQILKGLQPKWFFTKTGLELSSRGLEKLRDSVPADC